VEKLPNAKELKKLAEACRKAGIKAFKGYGIEFTLSDEAPVSNYKKRAPEANKSVIGHSNNPFESDTLTDDQLLMWSVSDIAESKTE